MYDFKAIEEKWRPWWEKNQIYQPNLQKAKKPFYNLMMFPYPSAEGLHVGNVYAFIGADVYGRLQRMQGYDVFEPIGLDGFGIHSENYAIQINKHPAEQAKISEKRFYHQLSRIGNGFAWKNHLETYDLDYYRWTQWLFIQMYKNKLAYRQKSMVNWCPSCKTVLADEQVEGGICERCQTPSERKETEQWFFKITQYAEKLLKNLEKLNWPKKILLAQKNWIGKSEGIEITWKITNSKEKIYTFTTRPDTIYGATFLVLAPDHPILSKFDLPSKAKNYQLEALKKTEQKRKAAEKNKTGVDTGLKAIHPLTGQELPIWIADFVLMNYGTGAIMSVPDHDERDHLFAKKNKLPIIKTPLTPAEKVLKKLGQAGKKTVSYHLRDWLISRQRYWGPPIPMINCQKCGWIPVPEKDLPVKLPEIKDFKPTGDGKSPLEKAPDSWLYPPCPQCGAKAKRETDVSDTFLDSSWYFLRYPSIKPEIHSNEIPWDPQITKKWLPVNKYIGGAEHAVLHLLYSRFVTMTLKDWGHLDFDEPFPNLFSHGLIIKDGAKMSKSRGNIIIPDKYLTKYGADSLRLYLMFLGPYSQGGDFRDSGLAGMNKFINKIYRWYTQAKFSSKTDPALTSLIHQTIKKVTEDLQKFKYNTAIAALMTLFNRLHESDSLKVSQSDAQAIIKLFAPLAPFLAETIWVEILKQKPSIHLQPWPKFNPKLIKTDTLEIPVQINGKFKAKFIIPTTQANDKQILLKLAEQTIQPYLKNQKIKQSIIIPEKLVNIVL